MSIAGETQHGIETAAAGGASEGGALEEAHPDFAAYGVAVGGGAVAIAARVAEEDGKDACDGEAGGLGGEFVPGGGVKGEAVGEDRKDALDGAKGGGEVLHGQQRLAAGGPLKVPVEEESAVAMAHGMAAVQGVATGIGGARYRTRAERTEVLQRQLSAGIG